jgi:NitT/TauT family transport system ATP-binding protein
MSDIVINIENLNLKIDNNVLFSDFSIQILKGERVGITGPSGCGKSTLLKSIIRQSFPNTSSISKFWKDEKLLYSYIPQKNGLLPWYSLEHNLNIFKKDILLYDETISKFKINQCLQNFPHQLSGGEYQRSVLAQSIINQPNVFLADEPLTELDITNKRKLLPYWSDKIKLSNATLVLISHDIDTLIYMCDKIVILSDKPAKFLNQFSINLTHARSDDFLISNDFIHFKKQILESIQKK